MAKKTIVFDFDGVINSYKSGFKGLHDIPDDPVPGIKEAIADIRKKYRVVILSARCTSPGGILGIARYLSKHGIVVDDIVSHKPGGVVYIDDRALRFDGNAAGLLDEIESFIPWYQRIDVKAKGGRHI